MNTNEIYAVVKQQILEGLPDGLERASALLNQLMKTKKKVTGGIYIQTPIKLLKNTSAGFVSGTNALISVTPVRQLDYAIFNWKYYQVAANFTLSDYNIATGPEAVRDFIEDKTKGAMADAKREIASALWGSSAAPNQLYPEGLEDICAASGTAYGGLTDTDYTDDTSAWLPLIDASTATIDYQMLANLQNKIKVRVQQMGFDSSKFMGMMNDGLYTKMQVALQNQQMFITDKEMADAGFENFKVNGIPYVMDYYAKGTNDGTTADNWVVVLPLEALQLCYNFGFGNASPFDGDARVYNQPIISVQNWMSFNLVCKNRRLVGVNKVLV